MKIKVCGLKFPDNISKVAALCPDLVGFICYDRSPRYVQGMEDSDLIPIADNILKTGVFVDAPLEDINELIERYSFNAVQLHGCESPDDCKILKARLKVIKAFGVDDCFDFAELEPYYNVVDYFLFDTKTAARGGSGQTFDWAILDKYTGSVPFFLSGGISPDNIDEVKNIKHPMFYGVDLNSKFEVSPAVKDIEKLEDAFKKLRDEVRS